MWGRGESERRAELTNTRFLHNVTVQFKWVIIATGAERIDASLQVGAGGGISHE